MIRNNASSTTDLTVDNHLLPRLPHILPMPKRPTKATTSTALQQDGPFANNENGNLSEDHIKERFKALSEDTRQLFSELATEFPSWQINNTSDALAWGDHCNKRLNSTDLVSLFSKWMFHRRPLLHEDPDCIENIDLRKFKKYLAAANWKSHNEEYDRVFHLMWETISGYPTMFLLWPLNNDMLAVEVNFRCLTPRDPLHDSFEAYDIMDSNLDNVLGLRYQTGNATKEMIIAPFGQILLRKASNLGWRVSQYALVLEIREDGVTGDFYIVYNIAHADLPTKGHKDLTVSSLTGEAKDDTVNFKPVLCGQGPFTVAKVKTPLGLELLGPRPRGSLDWLSRFRSLLSDDVSRERSKVQLDFLSLSKPEIVMTGMRESQKGRKIVGLYDDE